MSLLLLFGGVAPTTSADAGLASATAAGNAPTVTDAPNGGLGSVAATGTEAPVSIKVNAGLASVTATGQGATASEASVYGVTLSATHTQTPQILYSYIPNATPVSTGGGVKERREPRNFSHSMSAVVRQTATVESILVPSGLPLLEDDEEALLLLV